MLNITRHIASQGYDRIRCWAVPVALQLEKEVLLLCQKQQISAIDCFSGLSLFRSFDNGETWSKPVEVSALADIPFPDGTHESFLSSVMHKMDDGKILVLVTTFRYDPDGSRTTGAYQEVKYLYFEPETGNWSQLRKLELDAPTESDVLAVTAQFTQLENSDLLLPYSVRQKSGRFFARIARLRLTPDGTLDVVELSDKIVLEEGRGFFEPSLCRFDGKYFLTVRNDQSGYISSSETWKSFPAPHKLCRTDGEWLGNYNTMTRLIALGGKLYLVYTRKGLNNDHVFRHRAPLLVAEVDTEKLAIKLETEQIAAPEHGARLCNFTAVSNGKDFAYISVAEWMQTLEPDWHECIKCEEHGADNRVWYIELKS